MTIPRSPLVVLGLVLTLLACGGSRPRDAPDSALAAAGDGGDAAASGGDAAAGDAATGDVAASTPRPLAEIGAAACAMAGGTCGPGTAASVVIANITCDPGVPQQACVRTPADCGDVAAARCCSLADGKPTATVATCDRGYPTCSVANGEWLAVGDCSTPRRPLPAATLPSRWPGAVSVRAATRWACAQAGGVTTAPGQPCVGVLLPFAELGVAACCAPPAACPAAHPDTDCCDARGTVMPKRCVAGRAQCDAVFVQLGSVRETPRGTCVRFAPELPD